MGSLVLALGVLIKPTKAVWVGGCFCLEGGGHSALPSGQYRPTKFSLKMVPTSSNIYVKNASGRELTPWNGQQKIEVGLSVPEGCIMGL